MIESVYRRIGARIQTLRLACGISQAQLGASLRPRQTRASVANIEAAKQRLMLHTALQIAHELGESLESLLIVPAVRHRGKKVRF